MYYVIYKYQNCRELIVPQVLRDNVPNMNSGDFLPRKGDVDGIMHDV